MSSLCFHVAMFDPQHFMPEPGASQYAGFSAFREVTVIQYVATCSRRARISPIRLLHRSSLHVAWHLGHGTAAAACKSRQQISPPVFTTRSCVKLCVSMCRLRKSPTCALVAVGRSPSTDVAITGFTAVCRRKFRCSVRCENLHPFLLAA